MKQRCYNPNNQHYQWYGAKGITICDEWLGDNGWQNFFGWSLRHGYNENLTIDRIDSSKGYSPDNCQWITQSENSKRSFTEKSSGKAVLRKQSEDSKISKAQQKAVNKYVKNNYDRINVTFPKGQKEILREHAKQQNESVNAFIVRSVSETMERDNQKNATIDMRTKSDTLSPNLSPVPTPTLPESPAAAKKQEKQYQPFTDEDAKQINLQKLLESMPYQIEVANRFGMDALAKLMEKARQQCAEAGQLL